MIKSARIKAGLTQVQAASMIGAAVRTWQDWEAGRRNIPPAKLTLFLILLDARQATDRNGLIDS